MCLILVAYRHHPRYHLIIAANRDEFFQRPTAPAAWWGSRRRVLAGRDLEAGGTWLGVTRGGRFAALTNYRDPPAHRPEAPSRGALVTGYLEGDQTPATYLDTLSRQAGAYNGFNLLVADRHALYGYSNRGDAVQQLQPGVHGISNGLLDEPWAKVTRGRASLDAAVATGGDPDVDALLALLADRRPVTDEHLPHTGIGEEWERLLSSRFIAAPGYGTRCSTVLLWDVEGRIRFVERSFDALGGVSGTVDSVFEIDEPEIRV